MCNHLAIPGQIRTTRSLTADDPALEVWRSIFRVNVCLSRRIDQRLEETHQLSLSSLQALIAVQEAPDGRLRMSELADAAGLSRSGLTRLADRLERDGLLSRGRCSEDARGAFACLTQAGEARVSAARATYRDAVTELLLHHLSQTERAIITEALERVANDGLGGCGCDA